MKCTAAKCSAAIVLFLLAGRGAFAQGSAPAATSPDADDYLPANLDHVLADPITLNAKSSALANVAGTLRSITHANIVMNWNALARAGITKQTPVELQLKDVPFEQVVKTLCDILPATGTRVNYTVGDNILTLTTDAELGKMNVPVLEDVARVESYTLEREITPEKRAENEQFLAGYFKEALERAGEPMEAKGHALAVKQATLAATVSSRGKEILEKALRQISAPTTPGQYVAGTQLTVDAKKAAALFEALRDQPLATLAQQAADHPHGLNIALLPGAIHSNTHPPAEPLAKTITDGGIILIGPKRAIAARTVLGVYDLRGMLKRGLARPGRKASPADLQAGIIQSLQSAVPPGDSSPDEKWGTLGSGPISMTPYNGLLIVFATPETHRAITEALHKMNP